MFTMKWVSWGAKVFAKLFHYSLGKSNLPSGLEAESSGNNPIDHFDVCIGNLLYLSSSGKSNFMIAPDIYNSNSHISPIPIDDTALRATPFTLQFQEVPYL